MSTEVQYSSIRGAGHNVADTCHQNPPGRGGSRHGWGRLRNDAADGPPTPASLPKDEESRRSAMASNASVSAIV